MFLKKSVILAGVAMIPVACAVPTKRATADPAEWTELHRAAQLSSAAYTGCTGTAFDVTITKQLNDLVTDTQGFIGYSSEKKRITVAMRGSTSATDIANDVDTTLVTPTLSGVNFPSGAQIMHGIYSPWSSVHDTVISEVKSLVEQYPDYDLESTGHSLGGSLTYMSYIALTQNFPGKKVISNALAAYPIGNSAFAAFGTSQNGTLNRGNNAGDGVPNMYVMWPYDFVHYGTEYYSSGTQSSTVKCSGERDTQCSAGNGMLGVTAGHFSNFGISLGLAGCSASVL
ncbi:putative alkaline lipase [Aspergillus saccharolyticus JOP 1030-1]|uniref:feruloyl esterase n=1 Tax=Aspergillus saccharolyticus JOP 1030-1 TaxID=1450539 RepID=A0A318Z5Z2_9EURO|nr:lipase [Aspergillus saccharolyticus JOP 1030-1]PYH41787.1 lipase [Aspergillus saccharolyticus JOP 1030-1]